MYQIKTLNAIDDIIYQHLSSDAYAVSADAAAPEGILVRSANMHETALPDSLLAIARAGAGTNNIPLEQCAEAGIVVFNTPGANANAVKELVIAGLLLSGRKIIDGANWAQTLGDKGAEVGKLVEKGKNNFVGPELKGRKLGVIGLGAIGAMVANAAYYGLGMKVYGYDPFISVESAWHLSRHIIRSTDLDDVIAQCDYITVHVPLMDKTRGMLGEAQFAQMKPGAVVLNFARGELVDNPAMLKALADGQLRRYVTDFPSAELIGNENVLCIPHLGASTPDSETNCADMAAAQLKDYLENGNIVNSVNFPACSLPRTRDHRLCVLHRNVANMVGQVTAALGAAGVNIDTMINKSRGNYACTILELDGLPDEAVVSRIASINGILRVRAM
ncbi:MAG: 3-phosphoglycerate dehydrogenase family protein [Eubacteriales bacterium]|nr:3-phosphoglycerate dehydrogenase family protein [Eubacteriales bacterium]